MTRYIHVCRVCRQREGHAIIFRAVREGIYARLIAEGYDTRRLVRDVREYQAFAHAAR